MSERPTGFNLPECRYSPSHQVLAWLMLAFSVCLAGNLGWMPPAKGEPGSKPPAAKRAVVKRASIAASAPVATVISSTRIPQPRMTTEALYRLSSLSGGVMDWRMPEGLFQTVHRSGQPSEALELQVVQREPSDVSVSWPDAAHATVNPELVRLARRVAGMEKRAYFAARLLRTWVYRHIAPRETAMRFSASRATLTARSGDCSDRAVLLAKLAQALGIPARVAIGPVYMPDGNGLPGKFVGHAWTEVLIGERGKAEWTPLDASFPQDLTDATHIRLFDGSPDDPATLRLRNERMKNRLGRVRMEVLRAISPIESLVSVGHAPGTLATGLPDNVIVPINLRDLPRRSIASFRVQPLPAEFSADSPDGLFTHGLELLSQGDAEGAETQFQRALDKLRRPVALYRMAERLTGIEMYALASDALRRATAATEPSAAGYKQSLPSPYLTMTESWRQHFFPSVTLPDALNRRFLRAVGLADGGNRAEAIAILKDVIRDAPGFAPAYRRLGELTSGAESLRWLRRAVALAPRDPRNPESLGDALMGEKRFEEAASAYQAACRILQTARFDGNASWLTDAQAKRKLASGSALLAQHPKDATGWLMIAQGLQAQHRLAEADQALANAMALRPGNSEALLLRFRIALQRADRERMNSDQAAISRLAGGNAMAGALLGEYRMRMRQYDTAMRTLQRAMTLNPRQAEAYLTLSRVNLRLAERQSSGRKNRQAAYAVLKRGLAAVPPGAGRREIALALTRLLLEDRQPTAALRLAQPWITANPLDGEALLAVGAAHRIAGNRIPARAALEDVLTLNPNDPEALLELGHLALAEGNHTEAAENYRKAHLADPLNIRAAIADRRERETLRIRDGNASETWYLTDDEHDYLVRILSEGRQLKLGLRSYLSRIAALPVSADGRVSLSVAGAQAIESFQPYITRLYATEQTRYGQLRAMRPPARFANLHRLIETVCLSHMDVFNAALKRFPTMEAVSEADKAEYGMTLIDLNLSEQAFASEIGAIALHVPEAVFKGLAYEAQLEDMAAINQDISSLSGIVAARYTGKKPTEVPVSLRPEDLPPQPDKRP